MFLLSTEIELTILGVASMGALLLGAALITLVRLVASNKIIMQNQQKQNELLITMSNILASQSEEENRRLKQESIRPEKSPEQQP